MRRRVSVTGDVDVTGLTLSTNGLHSTNVSTNVAATGTVALEGKLSTGARYVVHIASQPTNATCTVSNGSGNVGTADVTNIAVNCLGH